ncbi:vascular cell adhesion protein 1b isoform X2 [Alosa sapidissima]|uniref:vascular cell adhesion protein 1b isoform X1 n=1 Tax=Alosa sapidissima TaxID=34773 RepID=UPI001C083D12|nr:vascular cell adhesion protein 1b isoform X1 [Alosa sapidissima]XP_041913194.1 vascular cell adhesion protein 1b isoform X2 [Alosa sapidissima]
MASALFWIVLFSPTVLSFVVIVSPRKGFFRVGDQERVVCNVTGCAQTPDITWGALEDKPIAASIETLGSESVITYKNVKRNDENRLVCKAKCGGEQWKQGEITVKVYEFPEVPVITGHERLVLGEPATLTCNVSGVYPGQETEMEWLTDGETASDPVEGTGNTLVSSFPLTPTHADEGRNITCRAWHRMWGGEKSVIQTSVTLSVLYGPGEVQVSGAAEVQVGDTLSLRCSAEGRPRPQLRWRIQRLSGQWAELEGGQELVVATATHAHAGQYQCVASNTLGESHACLNVSVQGPPRNTSLTLSPPHPIREGESVTLSCRTLSVPVGTVRLLHGEKELRSAVGSEVDITLDDIKLDQAGRYHCKALNRYGTHTNSTQLTITAHPLQLELLPVGVVTTEIGSALSLVCEASGCPHPQLSWATPSSGVEGATRDSANSPRSELSLRLDSIAQEGNYTCLARCGSVTTSRHTQVALFSFPTAPLVERSGSLLEGEQSTFRCVLRDAYPREAFLFRWLLGDLELTTQTPAETTPAFESSVSVTMEQSLRGRPLTCEAELLMGGVPDVRRRSSSAIIMDVHHPPRNTSLTLSPPHPIREGESVTLSCRTLSVPVGTVRLLHGEKELRSAVGSEVDITLPAAQLDQAGHYHCEASNQYGTHTNSTQLTVTAPPRNTTVEVFPSQRVMEGENVTICCRSVSFPPPLVTLTKLGNATEFSSHNGTFVLTNLTPSDTGDYQVNVTNDLGFHTQVFTISVMERSSVPSDGWEALLIPAVVIGSTLASAALLLDFVLRSRKKGSYKLAKCNSSSA